MDLAAVDAVIREGIEEGAAPGACYAIGCRGEVAIRSFGRFTYAPDSPAVMPETIWDLASLTKVIGTTTAAMLLYEEGRLPLDRPVADILPSFGKPHVTLRNLLLHNSGLAASHPNSTAFTDREALLASIFSQELAYETGSDVIYSDLGFIVLGCALEALSGMPLDAILDTRVWQPLGMRDTGFHPAERDRCAPTETPEPWRLHLRRLRGAEDRREWIQGEVHDPTALVLGGIAGHAGLFSTASDLATFMTALPSLVSPSTLDLFTTPAAGSRALGWDTPSEGSSAGSLLGPGSYGHTGFTGTSVWANQNFFAILLTNRVHPTATNQRIRDLRIRFIDAAWHATASSRGDRRGFLRPG
ncbi:MAG TPA: serine hydrolase domain-containing protein [Fimbriimonadaceae bacterium]|nr:serine hydrolase domain-containing protein [Fimbriimonadaceae bacterium]